LSQCIFYTFCKLDKNISNERSSSLYTITKLYKTISKGRLKDL
jgi:hypothetical protein